MSLPIKPPYPPMDALSASEVPMGPEWQYEPKWDGFRCLAFRDGTHVELQSKAGQPLGRHFPEIAQALLILKPTRFVVDGEIVIPVGDHLSFDDLLLHIHPTASRVRKLRTEEPRLTYCFRSPGRRTQHTFGKRNSPRAPRLTRALHSQVRARPAIDSAIASHREL
jgi:ATP-dependent DNA ligase